MERTVAELELQGNRTLGGIFVPKPNYVFAAPPIGKYVIWS
jgi:hypothetical protein